MEIKNLENCEACKERLGYIIVGLAVVGLVSVVQKLVKVAKDLQKTNEK